jgi:hypothetical protein
LSVLSHFGDQEEDPSVAGERFGENVVIIDWSLREHLLQEPTRQHFE